MAMVVSGLGIVASTGYVVRSVRGGSATTTTARLVATTVRNTSPIWVPILVEATLGRPAAWMAISLIGISTTPSCVLIGVAAGTYMIFSTAVKAIQWARSQSPEHLEQVMEQLQGAVRLCEEIVLEKREALENLLEAKEPILQAIKSAQRQLSEYSKEHGGGLDINDGESLTMMRDGAERILRETMEFLEDHTAQVREADQQLEEATEALNAAKQRITP